MCDVQWYHECYCGDNYDRLGPADNCDTPCSGDNGQICGGALAISVYTGLFYSHIESHST